LSSKRILKLNRNKRYILTLVLIVTLVCAAGCGQGVGSSTTTFEATSSTTTSTLPVISTIPGHSITVLDAKKLLDSGSKTTVFIDIRNQTDYDQNHVPGAVLITAVELPSRLSEVPHDKQVIVYAGCL
jgi:ABC-type transport system substrate-binding protein